MILDPNKIKQDFPILSRKINGKDLIYLDNAATSQKPQSVIDSIVNYYSTSNANVHRGAHTLSDEATTLYESSRAKVANFIGARIPEEVFFIKNASEGLNYVALSWGEQNIKSGDVVLTSIVEHNSNLLPWQVLCEKKGAKLEYVALDKDGLLDWNDYVAKLTNKVRVVVIAHASNVLGTIYDIKKISKMAKEVGALVVVDGAQSIPHLTINVQSLGCDFFAFSSHKMLGPMGIGVLWGREDLLNKVYPLELGGGTVLEVDRYTRELLPVPERFEAGTPNVEGAVGLAAAIDYLNNLGMQNVREHEIMLSEHAIKVLSKIEGLKILGPLDSALRTGLVSFTLEGVHPHDLGAVLNNEGIAVRSGMHCAMVLHKTLNISSSTRASYYVYNTTKDLDKLAEIVEKSVKLFRA
jgi:cysteine desulfurase / selenocysteine lyase